VAFGFAAAYVAITTHADEWWFKLLHVVVMVLIPAVVLSVFSLASSPILLAVAAARKLGLLCAQGKARS
jgi:hypothetical protein